MYVMIAKITENKKLVGFRIMDTETLSYFDCSRNNMVEMQKAEEIKVENLKYVNSRFSTSPTSLDLYPTVGVETKTKCNKTLIKYLDGFTYYVADRDGKLSTMTLKSFIDRYDKSEICNVPKAVIEEARAVQRVSV